MARKKAVAPGANGSPNQSDLAGTIAGLLNELQEVNKRLLDEVAERKKAEAALRERERTIRALLNAPQDTALLIDKKGAILAANETALARLGAHAINTLGADAEELVGHCVYDLFPAELSDLRKKRNVEVLKTGKPARYEDERDGKWFDNSIYPVRGPRGAVVGLAIFSKDITESKRGEHALRESQETVKALLNAPTDAALLIDPGGNILALNEMAAARLSRHVGEELTQEMLRGRCVYDLFPPEIADRRRERNENVVRSGHPIRFEDERDGAWFDNSTYPVLSADGKVTALAIFTRDITEQKQAEQVMKRLAYRDSLTGLPNRTAFQIRFSAALADARSRKKGLAVMALDLDGFKSINDSHGHTAGDHVLKSLGERLVSLLRSGDTAARLGGDEFVIILPGVEQETHAHEVAERIIEAVNEPFDIDGNRIQAGTSIGIALFPRHGDEPATLLRFADQAMYRAKEQGANQHKLFDRRWRNVRPTGHSDPITSAAAR